MAKILAEVFDPAAAPLIASDVLDEREIAEFTPSGFGSLLRSRATLFSITRGHFEMAT